MTSPVASTKQAILASHTIQAIFDTFPAQAKELALIMTRHGLHCVGCHASVFETLEQGMLGHGFSSESLQTLLSELNAAISDVPEREEITLTESAANKIQSMLQEQGKTHWGLRFGLRHPGLPYEYILNFREGPTEDQIEIRSCGIRLFLSIEDRPKLRFSKIDFIQSESEAGFKIDNPNEVANTSSCHG